MSSLAQLFDEKSVDLGAGVAEAQIASKTSVFGTASSGRMGCQEVYDPDKKFTHAQEEV